MKTYPEFILECLQRLNVEKFDWRKSLQESDWSNVTSGNKVGQTFKHIPSGQTVSTGGALGGVESISSTISIDGDSVDGPNASEYSLEGYAKTMGWEIARKNNKKKAKQINAQLDASEKVAKKANADALMQARVDEFQEKVDKINAYNETVRIHNWEKVTDYVKSLKLKGITARDLQKKGVIKIKGGAVGMKDDGKGNITIRVFKGPDVYVKGMGIYYLGQDYTTEGEDFNTEEGVVPVPARPDDLQKWLDAKYQKTVDLYNMSDNDILDRLATKYSVGVSKDMFDYYMDNFVDNPNDANVNMNRIFKPHLNRIKGYMPEIEKLVKLGQTLGHNPEKIQRDINNYWNSSISPQMPADLRNSLGNGSRPDVKNFIKTGNWQINKSFVYTEPDDFQGREFGPKWLQALSNKLPKLYARLKSIQKGEWGSLIPFTNKPMRYNITVPGSPVPIVKPQSKETDTRKALSLDEPIVRDKKKK